uniref:Uncharacterized protein n=1 Tax=Magallana gigas TaxID=29159 RepID=A0A8W8ISZ3_MAGGI|nr:uncharacterized protein LOC105331156 [Crassostrea gigas]
MTTTKTTTLTIAPATEITNAAKTSSTPLPQTTQHVSSATNNTARVHSGGLPKDELEIIIIVICLIALIALILLIYVTFKKFRNSKLCLRLTQFTRVRTTSSSHHPLDPDDVEEDLPPPRTERELFSIGDHDDIDTRLGGAAPSDDYFFDEIYEKSAFVDETTHSSIKDLKLESERDNVPDLLFRSPR